LIIVTTARLPFSNWESPRLQDWDRLKTVQTIEKAIQSTYVFPEMRSKIVARLEQSRRSGRYDVSEPSLFAQRVTEDLQKETHDGHLYLRDDLDEYLARISPVKSEKGLATRERQEAAADNSGLTKSEVLNGNIRYLRITGFQWSPDLTPAVYRDAARFLRGGDALIIDLRANPGGNSNAADRCESELIRPNRSKPVYILVDGYTGSAAEAVAYGAQQEKSATIVGIATYGAANNNRKFAVAPRFILSVSYNRPINPITGTNWEGVGVKPDIPASPKDALATAEFNALNKLASRPNLSASDQAEYRWDLTGVETLLHPSKVDPTRLRTYAGAYGPIQVDFTSGALTLTRADRPRWPKSLTLSPLHEEGLFTVESFEGLRVRFAPKALTFLYGSEADTETFPRTNPPTQPQPAIDH
jgi:hypothetical protein